jgi:hypothetical protein
MGCCVLPLSSDQCCRDAGACRRPATGGQRGPRGSASRREPRAVALRVESAVSARSSPESNTDRPRRRERFHRIKGRILGPHADSGGECRHFDCGLRQPGGEVHTQLSCSRLPCSQEVPGLLFANRLCTHSAHTCASESMNRTYRSLGGEPGRGEVLVGHDRGPTAEPSAVEIVTSNCGRTRTRFTYRLLAK